MCCSKPIAFIHLKYRRRKYNNFNMPDNFRSAMSAFRKGKKVSACGRTQYDDN